MHPAQASGGLVERAVKEAIDAVAAPTVRDAILALALRWGRHERVPEHGLAVPEFVENALFFAAEQSLGGELARSIVEQLQPIATMAARQEISTVRSSWPSLGRSGPRVDPFDEAPLLELDDDEGFDARDDHDDDEGFDDHDRGDSEDDVVIVVDDDDEPSPRHPLLTDPAPRGLPLVLVSTSDPARIDQLGQALLGVATIIAVSDALAILDGLGEGKGALVVVDCRRPTIQLETLLAMAPELPRRHHIVLWGERPDLERRLSVDGDGLPDEWVCCGAKAEADDVGAVCRVLLG